MEPLQFGGIEAGQPFGSFLVDGVSLLVNHFLDDEPLWIQSQHVLDSPDHETRPSLE